MTKLLCVSDVHDEESKFAQMAGWAKGHDAILTAGDDLDRYIDGQMESNVVLTGLMQEHSKTSRVTPQVHKELRDLVKRLDELPPQRQKSEFSRFLEQHPEVAQESARIENDVKNDFIEYFAGRAAAINAHYEQAGIPAFGTAGNHDPLPALGEQKAVKYLLGEAAKLKELTIAGLPATGEWVSGPMRFCPEFYPHLNTYSPQEVSGLAKKIMNENKQVDVFITHKSYKQGLQEWDKYYKKGQPLHEFGVDAGAVAVDKKFKPALNVFGHYHMARAKVKRSEDGKQWFLYVGPNAAVTVTVLDKKPSVFESRYYSN